jgi:hypothetical protein
MYIYKMYDRRSAFKFNTSKPLAPALNFRCNMQNSRMQITGFDFLDRTVITEASGDRKTPERAARAWP